MRKLRSQWKDVKQGMIRSKWWQDNDLSGNAVTRRKWARIAFIKASEKAAEAEVKADDRMSEKQNCESY